MLKATTQLSKLSALAAAVLIAVCIAAPAGARSGEPPGAAEPRFGRTLPPVGFVDFCRREPDACARRGAPAMRPKLSARQWDAVYRVNSFVNAAVTPARDQDLYGTNEYWAYPRGAGDCEDYVLLKQRLLEGFGIARSALLVTVVLDDRNEGHAVLTLATSEGDFILDNRRNAIRRWSDLSDSFLKRQSEQDPREWVSLSAETPRSTGWVAAPADPPPE